MSQYEISERERVRTKFLETKKPDDRSMMVPSVEKVDKVIVPKLDLEAAKKTI